MLLLLGRLPHLRLARAEGNSMLPRLRHGTYLLVDTAAYRRARPERGHVVLARHPQDPERALLKRVIGLPGETVEVRDGTVHVNDQELDEPYALGWGLPLPDREGTWSLAPDAYFLLGDNRVDSIDSRDLGPISRTALIGRVRLALWPRSAWGRVR